MSDRKLQRLASAVRVFLTGALIVTVINNSLVLLGVSPYVQQAVQGIIIIVAVALSIQHGKSLIVK